MCGYRGAPQPTAAASCGRQAGLPVYQQEKGGVKCAHAVCLSVSTIKALPAYVMMSVLSHVLCFCQLPLLCRFCSPACCTFAGRLLCELHLPASCQPACSSSAPNWETLFNQSPPAATAAAPDPPPPSCPDTLLQLNRRSSGCTGGAAFLLPPRKPS